MAHAHTHPLAEQEAAPDEQTCICEKCQYIFDRWYLRPRKDGHESWEEESPHHSLSGLVKSAKSCSSCRLFTSGFGNGRSLKDVIALKGEDALGWPRIVPFGDQADHQYLYINYEDEGAWGGDYTCVNVVNSSGSDERQSIPLIANTTDNEVTWDRAREWIRWCTSLGDQTSTSLCHKRHSACQASIMEERLPRRLIHISDDNENIRLCLTEDIDVSGARLQYATLTHCWGRMPMPILATRENLDEMLCRIPFESLTKTFQDAIKIARRLGFQYLWIDTLCILQGDADDWMSEAVMMGSIYASCSLNIVASASPEGSIGCFFDRDTELHRGLKVLAFTEEKSEQRTILNCMPNNLPLYGSFTAKRAWCFQETFLAPRSLSFHRDQIYWQCRVFTANETFPQGLVHEDPPLRSRTYRSRSREQLNSTFEWFKLVNMYSSGQVTYWKDKLIAMSGVARLLSKDFPLDAMDDGGSSGQSYLAGLWKSDLASQLLWCMSKPCPRQYPQSTPSWSWASVDGPIMYPKHMGPWRSCFRIIDACTTLATDDEFGAVNGGTLRLQCNPLVPVALVAHEVLYEIIVNGIPLQGIVYPDALPLEGRDFLAFQGWEGLTENQGMYRSNFGLLLEPTGAVDTFRRVASYFVLSTQDNTTCVHGDDAYLVSMGPVKLSALLPFNQLDEQKVITII